jgi:hypothetical protein
MKHFNKDLCGRCLRPLAASDGHPDPKVCDGACVDDVVTFTLPQAWDLLAMFGGEDSELSVGRCDDGHAGPGLYAWHTEYPELGSMLLGDRDRSERLSSVGEADTVVSHDCLVIGLGSAAKGKRAIAVGIGAKALADDAVAVGNGVVASEPGEVKVEVADWYSFFHQLRVVLLYVLRGSDAADRGEGVESCEVVPTSPIMPDEPPVQLRVITTTTQPE